MHPNMYYPYPMLPPPDDRQKAILEEGMKIAERLMIRKEREKERHDKIKRTQAELDRKKAAARAARRFNLVETYILGIVSYPIWAPLAKAFIHYLEHLQ